MCSRESLSRRCVLVKQVPEEVEDDCIYRIRGVEKSHRHNELSISNGEVIWIVLLSGEDYAEKLIRNAYVTLDLDGQELDLPVGSCPECIIPDEWIYNSPTGSTDPMYFDRMKESIDMKSIGLTEEAVRGTHVLCLKDENTNPKKEKEKVEDSPEEIEGQDIYVPKFVIPALTSLQETTVAQVAVFSTENRGINESTEAQAAVFPSEKFQSEGMTNAKSCLQMKHKIGGVNIKVKKYDTGDPEMWEMNKVLVGKLNPVTSDDTLINFLELAAGLDVIKVVRGSGHDTVIVVFDEKPDFSKIIKRCNAKKLEGNTLFIQMVEKCRSVYVHEIDENITYDTLENFFCNKRRSGGGEVEEVDYHPEDGYCVVLFENPTDAENVASRKKFTINGKEISVQLFHPCLGLPEQPINWEDLPTVIHPCNKHLLRFLKSCEAVAKEIEKTLQQKFIQVEWPKSNSDTNIKLLCSLTKEVENARDILKNWKKETKRSMENLMDKFVIHKHPILLEAWQGFLDKLNALNIDNPDKVAVLLSKEHTIFVVGFEENAEAVSRTILHIVKTEELKIKTPKEQIEKSIPLDFHKCQQLWKTQYHQKIKNDFPDVDMNIEIGKKEVNFSGKSNEVNEVIIKMHEYLFKTKSKSLSISKGRHEVFKSKEVRDLFLAEMKLKNNKAIWNITEDKVEMTSSHMKMVEDALKLFEDFLPEKTIKVNQQVLYTQKLKACIRKMIKRDSCGEKMCILLSASGVTVTSTEDIFQSLCAKVEHVLEECFLEILCREEVCRN